ncbi:MAG: DUF1598 domain-containing protein [Pirellulales bacterium]|nr:DUF1598 domain-containing protein [Pirellulales bacterium]
MPTRGPLEARCLRVLCLASMAVVLVGLCCLPASAQFGRYSSVGGVMVNAEGILANATVDQTGELQRKLAEIIQPATGAIGETSLGRRVSLRRLEAAIQELVTQKKPIPEDMLCLAGLQSIDYVFVDPQGKDIILVGPAQGWKVSPKGAIVGAENGQPVMLLDDLVIAMRSARGAMDQAISVSIDPTPEGIKRLRSYRNKLGSMGNVQQTLRGFEDAMGAQKITLTGVPETSHFARVLVAADYRMKRISLGFDPSPVAGLPSYLSMLQARGARLNNMMPRWWLEPRFESVVHSPDGLAWQLKGASVKALTESAFFAANGDRKVTGKVDRLAQNWADLMTEKYPELAKADPVFGDLRNCMQLAIVGALIVKEDLANKAGYSMTTLLNPTDVEVASFPAPKQVPTIANAVRGNGQWLVTASGGVQINIFNALKDAKTSDSLDAERTKALAADKSWWWD